MVMRKVFLIGLVGLVSLAIAQPAQAWHRGHHARTSFGFHFFLPLGPWYAAPYPYYYPYSAPYYPYYSYPAPPAYSYIPPSPVVGYLHLEVEPRDAHIYVNGQYLGPVQQFAGSAATLAPGSHQVAVVAWGYRPFQQQLQIIAGQTSTMRVTLEPDPTAPVAPPSPRPGTY
jgi:hypothetical protein